MMIHTRFVCAALSVVLILMGCQRSQPVDLGQSGTQPVPIHQTFSGDNDALTQPGQWVINSEEELAARNAENVIEDQAVDFESQSLLLWALGEQPTGGYWAQITAVQVKGDRLFFQGIVNRPGEDEATTQALTYPYAAAVLPKVTPASVHPEIDSVEGQPLPTADD